MNCRKSIFKFLGIAAVCAASAACSVDDADDLALVKLGALKKEFVVEADANTFDIDIYANSAFHIERINQADWISLTCGETEDGKGAITAECEFNEGFKRKAGFVLCSDVDARRDTVYVKQKALVDAKIEFANSSVIVAGAGGENISPIETNIPFSEITVDIEYAKADNADWIESLEIVDSESENRSLAITTEANAADEIPRSATVSLSFTDGWEETVSVEFNLLQRTAKETLGRQITFEEFRQTYAMNKKVEDYVILEGIVVSNTKNHNAGENTQSTTAKIDYSISDRTVYLETYDGKYGIAVQTATAEDNVFEQYDHVQILIQGASGYLVETPDRYELRNVTKAMVISRIAGSASDVPVKEKWMSQLTDDDIYTYVTLTDCELPIRKGPLTPINEGYANATGANRTEKCASLVRDIEGEHIYLYTNTTCLYRRDGSRLPYGSGKLSGIVVHELFPRFEWEDNASGDDESYGYIGRYQLRHVSKSDFDGLAEDFEESFSALLTEYRFLQYDNNKVYPTYGTNGYLTHSYKDGTGAIKILANEDFSYLGPVGNKSSFIFGSNIGNVNGMGIILEDGTDWWRDNPDVNSNTSGDTSGAGKGKVPRKNSAEGPAWVDWYWWDKTNDRGHAWIVNFSTEGIETDVLSMQVSVLNDRYDSGKYGSPRYFDVAWSETGDMNADGDWTYIASYTVPDMARWTPATRYWQYAGWKPIDVKLPLEMLGKKNVYIRLQAARNLGGSLDEYAAQPIDSPSCMNYFAIRYNKK